MSAKDWHTRLADRWEGRLASRSPVDTSGRAISGYSWQWRLTVHLLMLALVVGAGVAGGPKAAIAFGAVYALAVLHEWWWRRRQVKRMGASVLLVIAGQRDTGWAKAGLTWEFGRQGWRTDNPASWLRLRGPHAQAVLTVWSSGDAKVDWGVEGDDATARNYSLSSFEELKACVDELEAALKRSP